MTMSRKVKEVLKKGAMALCNMSGAGLITYLYLVKAIEQAYLQRGYEAYGGEYLMAPFVFCGSYKLFSLVIRLLGKDSEKGGIECSG